MNTLLHIFGDWLFEASVWVGQDQEGFLPKTGPHGSTKVISSGGDLSRIQDNLPTASSILTPSQQKVCPFFLFIDPFSLCICPFHFYISIH